METERSRDAPGAEAAPTSISVLLAVHNGERDLSYQLAALGPQCGGDVEIVMVDDGSSDSSPDIIAEFAKRHPLTLISHPKPMGKAYCLNMAASTAQGEFLITLDQDDIIGDAYIERMGTELRRYPFVAARLEYDKLNPRWLADALRNAPNQDLANITLYGQKASEEGSGIRRVPVANGCALGIRRSVLTQLDGFAADVGVADDLDLCLRAEFAGIPYRRAETAVLHYRLRATARGLLSQRYGYGVSWAALYRKYRSAGMRRPGLRRTVREVLSSLRGVISASRMTRASGTARLGFTLGRIGGSVKYRAYYI